MHDPSDMLHMGVYDTQPISVYALSCSLDAPHAALYWLHMLGDVWCLGEWLDAVIVIGGRYVALQSCPMQNPPTVRMEKPPTAVIRALQARSSFSVYLVA